MFTTNRNLTRDVYRLNLIDIEVDADQEYDTVDEARGELMKLFNDFASEQPVEWFIESAVYDDTQYEIFTIVDGERDDVRYLTITEHEVDAD